MSHPQLILGIGELLWDMLPTGPQLGGAPANYAVMAARLGDHAAILSRIGRDELGRNVLSTLHPLPADTSHIQIDPEHPTGTVTVKIQDGQPGYTIHQSVAWDFLEATSEWEQLAIRADAVCFGSLAQRSETSRRTIQSLLGATLPECVRVFDVNLRDPFYSPEVLEESIEFATILKMNDAEVPTVLRVLDLDSKPGLDAFNDNVAAPDALLAGAQLLLAEFPMQLICITCGGNGSLLVTREETHFHPGIRVKVADTIGAGDAFTAALTHYYLQSAPLPVLNEAGNRWGGWIASQAGAMPPLSEDVRDSISTSINAATS